MVSSSLPPAASAASGLLKLSGLRPVRLCHYHWTLSIAEYNLALGADMRQAYRSGMGYRTPSLRRKVIIGHQLVKADWNRFSPTKAVNRYQ
jgi:hypothetical protein